MSKLGDLIVRLRLQYDDYKKGLKKADADTKGFAGTLGKIKGVGLAVFGALSAGIAAFANEFANHTNAIGDKWTHTMSAMKAGYHSVIADMSTYKPDFSSFRNFIKNEWDWIKGTLFNAKEAGVAASEMSAAFDAEFELVNSVQMQRRQIQQELNELYIQMRDTTLDPSARMAAAKKYKALIQPIADAEVRVYGEMVNKAVAAWQAGNELDRQYSVEEITEFFSKIGTEYEKMEKKFPDLMRVYETRKGDAQNIIIFDTINKLLEASNQMSEVDRILSRTTLAIKKSLGTTQRTDLGPALSAGPSITGQAVSMQAPQIFTDEWLNSQMAKGEEFMAWYMDMIDRNTQMNQMFENSIIQATSGGLEAFTDMLAGIDGADASGILSALMQPFANTAAQLGSMLLAEGIAVEAFYKSLASLQGGPAIAAGLALLAVSAAMKTGIKALSKGGGSSSAGAGGYNSGSAGTSVGNYESTLTVNVVGTISGNDIALSLDRTNKNKKR